MKIKNFLILIILLGGLTNCGKDENLHTNNGIINFRDDQKGSEVIVKYNEILGYDSTKCIFRVDETAWKRIHNNTSFDPPFFKLAVVLDNEIIYKATYVPGYISSSDYDIITFMLGVPDLVYMRLGYAASPELFTGEDLRNDVRLMDQLKEDNKIIEIED